jgi:(p)ppGpp synthase/HD superfamily hydrolase
MAIFSARVERAVAVALRARRDQIVHPITVALILSRYSNDEDVIIAGLLHDTLEDTKLAPEEIAREFGDKVLAMVQDVTEPQLPNLSWETRKARYLRHLENAPHGSLLVACADKIANLVSMLGLHAAESGAAWAEPPAGSARTLGFCRQVYATVRSAWGRCPLLDELRNRVEEAERKLLAPAR